MFAKIGLVWVGNPVGDSVGDPVGRTVGERFETVLERFGSFKTVFKPFQNSLAPIDGNRS